MAKASEKQYTDREADNIPEVLQKLVTTCYCFLSPIRDNSEVKGKLTEFVYSRRKNILVRFMESNSGPLRKEEIYHQKAMLEEVIPFKIAWEFEALMACPWYIDSYVSIADNYIKIYGFTTARKCYELVLALDPSREESIAPKLALAIRKEQERDEEQYSYEEVYEEVDEDESDAGEEGSDTESEAGEVDSQPDNGSGSIDNTASPSAENEESVQIQAPPVAAGDIEELGDEELPEIEEINEELGMVSIEEKPEEIPQPVEEDAVYDVTEEIEAALADTPDAPPNVMEVLKYLLNCSENVWVRWTAVPPHAKHNSEDYFEKLCEGCPIAIKDTPEMGRGMFLTEDVKADQILFEEDPLVMGMGRFDRCAYCVNAFPDPIFLCEKCGEKYCSENCRERAKNEWHDFLCGRGVEKFVPKANEPMIMIAKLIAYMIQNENGKHPLELNHITQLTSIFHFDFLNSDVKEVRDYYYEEVDFGFHGLYLEYLQVCNYLGKFHSEMLDFETYVRLTHIINTNSLEISVDPEDEAGQKVENSGSGVFIVYSHMNHDCASTVYCCPEEVNYNSRMILRAAYDLKAGSQIYVSYLDSEEPKSKRRYNLFHYGFLCQCEMCLNEEEGEGEGEEEEEEEVVEYYEGEEIDDDGYETVEETVEYIYEEDLPEEYRGDGEIEEIIEYIYVDGDQELASDEEYEEEVIEETIQYVKVTRSKKTNTNDESFTIPKKLTTPPPPLPVSPPPEIAAIVKLESETDA